MIADCNHRWVCRLIVFESFHGISAGMVKTKKKPQEKYSSNPSPNHHVVLDFSDPTLISIFDLVDRAIIIINLRSYHH